MAQVSGTLAVAGLTAPVRIVRDRSGVPHIYAQHQDDLFFAQGFVQAQDRLFQMDLWRRSVQGRLSEVLGPNFVERDAMTRRIQYRGDLDAEWASYGADTRAIATAFVRGVNAWVTLARERPPEEFVVAGWKPDLWAAEDLLNRTDAFRASGDALAEILRARLVAAVGVRRATALWQAGRPLVVPPGLDVSTISAIIGEVIRGAGTRPFFLGLATQPRSGRNSAGSDRSETPGTTDEITTYKSVVALEHPSHQYLVHLNAPGWNVIGATAPWLPGVSEGHNDRIAWDTGPFGGDTQDIFVEKVNPSNPHQVEDDGRWVDTRIVTEPIVIRGHPKPFMFDAELTRHGVVLASDRDRHLAFTLRWSGTEPGAAGELAVLALHGATSQVELAAAVARWKTMPQRVDYIDADGRRGSLVGGVMPIRRGWDGALPAPGWPGTYEWTGWQSPVVAAAPARAEPASAFARFPDVPADRVDALLPKLAAAATAADSLKVQRKLIADAITGAIADSMRAHPPYDAVLFSHPLAISDAARRRFNVGPIKHPPEVHGPFVIGSDPHDWDRSRVLNAPGQSGSPDSPHFSDFAKAWATGEPVELAFTDAAVQAAAESTLTLIVRTP